MRPVAENQDAGGLTDGGEPVRDDESGAAFHHFVERQIEPRLGHRIERAGRLVEDQDRRIFEQSARHREPLPLAAGQEPAALADPRFKPIGIAIDEIGGLRARRRRAQFVVSRIRLADAQVLRDRAVEQQRLLEHDADIVAQTRQR